MLLQCVDQDLIRHLQTRVQVDQIGVRIGKFLFGHVLQGTIEVVDAVEEVFGEALESKVFSGLDFALRLFLEVAVFCDLAL